MKSGAKDEQGFLAVAIGCFWSGLVVSFQQHTPSSAPFYSGRSKKQ
jgi:hypothetical protein